MEEDDLIGKVGAKQKDVAFLAVKKNIRWTIRTPSMDRPSYEELVCIFPAHFAL